MVDYICQYLTTVRERRVSPDVQPGYMRDLLPNTAPLKPDSWDNIFSDIEKIIMPGVRTWSTRKGSLNIYLPLNMLAAAEAQLLAGQLAVTLQTAGARLFVEVLAITVSNFLFLNSSRV